MNRVVVTKSAEQTEQLAAELASTLKGGEVICLDGEVGAGKTVFARGLARALGVSAPILSPTFTIFHTYATERFVLAHFDFYRLEGSQTEELGLEEYFGEPNTICVVEWSEYLPTVVPKGALKISIEVKSANQRQITWGEKE